MVIKKHTRTHAVTGKQEHVVRLAIDRLRHADTPEMLPGVALHDKHQRRGVTHPTWFASSAQIRELRNPVASVDVCMRKISGAKVLPRNRTNSASFNVQCLRNFDLQQSCTAKAAVFTRLSIFDWQIHSSKFANSV